MMQQAASMSYNARLSAAMEFMRDHDDFLVVSHVQPDGDAICSTLAVGWMLTQLGKTFTMMNEGPVPAKFGFLPNSERVVPFLKQAPRRLFRYVISIDCADFARVGRVSELFAEDAVLLNIDHHPTNNGFGTYQLIVPDAAATVEILYDLVVHTQLNPDIVFGTFIYTGLLTDTGGFRYSSVSPKVMQIAADLLKLGVPGHKLAEELLEKLTYPQINLLKKGLNSLSFAYDRKVAWVYVTIQDIEEIEASSEDMDGLVNYPRNIEGVQIGILFKQRDLNTWKVSLRSNSVNVADIAQRFGGGGHVRAAGCTLEGALERVVSIIVAEAGAAVQ